MLTLTSTSSASGPKTKKFEYVILDKNLNPVANKEFEGDITVGRYFAYMDFRGKIILRPVEYDASLIKMKEFFEPFSMEIDLKTNQITPWKIKLDNGQNELFGQNIINDIKQIPNLPQYLWITTNRGLLKYNYQTKKGHFIYFKGKKPTSSLDNLNNIFRSIVLESDSVLWISSWGGGILKYYPKSNVWTQYLSDKSLPKSGGKNIIKNIISNIF